MRRHNGFSLLELLVAFTVLAGALLLVMRVFSHGVSNARVTEHYAIAVQLAESILARSGVETPLVAGQQSGVEDATYHWRVNTRLQASAAIDNTNPTVTVRPQLFEVNVLVSWDDGLLTARQFQLSSYKLQLGESQ